MEYEIHVKMQTAEEIITLRVEESDTIQNVKNKIEDTRGHSVGSQQLFFAGEQLKDQHTLGHYGITAGSTLTLNEESPSYGWWCILF